LNAESQANRRSEPLPSKMRRDWLSCLSTGFLYYYLTSMIVGIAVVLGHDLLPRSGHPLAKQDDALHAFANWDGEWYLRIVTSGYAYDATKPSTVAFFPAYPLLAWGLACATGVDPVVALLIVAHASLIAAFALTLAYVRLRFPDARQELGEYVLLSLGLFPLTLFFRMAYSESLFVFLVVLCLYGMERRWPLFLVAVLVGLATAARPVGLALLPPFVLHVRHRSASAQQFGIRIAWLLPLSLWGIAAYMGYLGLVFGEPLAFLKTQANWRVYRPSSLAEKATALVTLKPVWGNFSPSSPGYWLQHTVYPNPFASLSFMNPLFFLAGSIVILFGLCRRWLSAYEILLACFLLAIPYVASSYEMHMAGMGRFVAAIFPLHLVLGQILTRLRGLLAAGLLSVSACFLTWYAALFAAWYQFY
jgi:hypothetical protein